MKYIHKGLMLTCFVALSGLFVGHAQQNQPLTLQDIYGHIQANYPAYLAKQQQLLGAQAALKHTQKGALPSLQIQSQINNGSYKTLSGGFLPLPGALNVSGNSQNIEGDNQVFGSFSSALLEVDIFSFGQQNKRNQGAKYSLESIAFDQELYLLELKAYVSQLYIELLFVENSLLTFQGIVDKSKQVQQLTTSLVQAGLRPEAQGFLAQASTMNYEGKLSQLKGLQTSLEQKITQFIPDFSTEQIAQRIPLFYNFTPIVGDEQALTTHPLLSKINANVNQYNAHKQMQQRAWLPSLKFLAGYSFRSSGISDNAIANGSFSSGFETSASNYIVGLGVVWKISEVFTSSSKVKELAAKTQSEQLMYQSENQRLQAQKNSVSQSLPLYFKSTVQSKEAVEKAEQSYAMYLARFESGLIDLAELLSIQEIILQTQQSHLDNVKQYWNAQVALALVQADFDTLGESL